MSSVKLHVVGESPMPDTPGGSLVVVCSPAAARSTSLDRAIHRYVAAHGRQGLLPIVVRGEPGAPAASPDACFPSPLRTDAGGGNWEPLAADARHGRDGRELAVLKVFAGICGAPLDRLRNREALRQRRVRCWALSGLAVFLLAAGGLAMLARRNERIADRRARAEAVARLEADLQASNERAARERVEALLRFMVVDLRKRLASVDREDALEGVATRAHDYYAAIDADRRSKEDRARLADDLVPVISLLRDRGHPRKADDLQARVRDLRH